MKCDYYIYTAFCTPSDSIMNRERRLYEAYTSLVRQHKEDKHAARRKND